MADWVASNVEPATVLRRHAPGCRFRLPRVPEVRLMLAVLDADRCGHCRMLAERLRRAVRRPVRAVA